MLIVLLTLVGYCIACGNTPGTGIITDNVILLFSVSPPIEWTYSDTPITNQASTETTAHQVAAADLLQAIKEVLMEENYVSGMAVDPEFTPPEVPIAEGSICTVPGTFLVSNGAVTEECTGTLPVTPKKPTAGTPAIPGETTKAMVTTVPLEQSTPNEETTKVSGLTEPDTTVSKITTDEETTTTNKISDSTTTEESTTTTDPQASPPPLKRVKRAVDSQTFTIAGSVKAKAGQLLFKNQWDNVGQKVQTKLEKKHAVFVKNVQVYIPK